MTKKMQKIEEINMAIIKPYWRNPRNNDKAIEVVRKSIERYGFNVPLVLDQNHVIITGHSRFKALIQLGYKKVPCVISDMDEQKAKEYRIADNKTSEFASWEMDSLNQELREIKDTEAFQAFYPEIDLEGFLNNNSGQNITPITVNQIAKKTTQLKNQFENDREESVIEILCPHCLEAILMDKHELKDKIQ